MIIVRPAAEFRMVCLSDPALDSVPGDVMAQYGETRNIELLQLDKLPDKPTVFKCRPLRPEWDHLADGDEMNSHQCWLVVSTHVSGIDPFPGDVKIITRNGDPVLDESVRKLLPRAVVREVAEVIVRWASADGDTIPFLSQHTSWGTERVMRSALRARSARMTETASAEDSK